VKSLHGKVAVITGSGSGIGQATAQSLAKRGAKIVVADIAGDDAFAVAGEIVEAGGQAVGIRCDVRANSDFEQLKTCALDQFGGVDVVMNNVGVLTRGRPEHLPVEEWQRIIDVDLFSVVRRNAVFLPLLIEQGHGHIVNTASFAGLFTYSYERLPYAAAKAAIVQISEGLRLYLHPRGVGVTVLCPGPVMTNIMASMPPGFGPDVATRGPCERFTPLQPEIVGEQVAEAILRDTFMVYTHDHVREILIERASDWNAFIAKQTAALQNPEALDTKSAERRINSQR
jgi:NAD(P)-dependent dehydrogenase (short-subunit alcohol dehydrogenase family)